MINQVLFVFKLKTHWIPLRVADRVKPENDVLDCLFLFVIPAVLKQESVKSYDSFNFFTNKP